MLKKISTLILIVSTLSLSAPRPSYAWKAPTGLIIAGLITAPIWLPIALIYQGIEGLLESNHRKNYDAKENAREQQLEHVRLKLREFFISVNTQIRNDYNLYTGGKNSKFDPDLGLAKVIEFLDRYVKATDSAMMDPAAFLCLFRSTLLSHLPPGSLKPNLLASYFEQYERTGNIPEEFISLAGEHLKLTPAAAESVFSILYGTTLTNGIQIKGVSSTERAVTLKI